MYMTALIRSSDVKKIEPIMVYEGINTISVHAVHAGTERNVCNIVSGVVLDCTDS